MTCTHCKYEWCWICGLPFKSFWHYGQGMGFMCEMIACIMWRKNKSMCGTILLAILMWLVMPAILLGMSLLLGLMLGVMGSGSCLKIPYIKITQCCFTKQDLKKKNCCLKFTSNLIVTIPVLLLIALGIALAVFYFALFTTLIFGIFILPCMFLFPIMVYKCLTHQWANSVNQSSKQNIESAEKTIDETNQV